MLPSGFLPGKITRPHSSDSPRLLVKFMVNLRFPAGGFLAIAGLEKVGTLF